MLLFFLLCTAPLPSKAMKRVISSPFDITTLSLSQKIGQLFMITAVSDEEIAKDTITKKTYPVDKEYVTKMITDYHVGGIIYLGQSDSKKQIERTKYFQSISKIPLLVGQDLEPGRVGKSRFPNFFLFKSNEKIGKRNELTYTQNIGCIIGELCKTLGVHINFAPVADVNSNPNNPIIGDRSFGSDPKEVAKHAIAFAQGLQESGIVACAKHFPGHGDTTVDSHDTLPKIDKSMHDLLNTEIKPFKELIKADIPMIMVGHIAVRELESEENLPATLSKDIVTGYLKEEFGFKGIVITDALDMNAITLTEHYKNGQAELQALIAGNDILLCPVNLIQAITSIKKAILDGTITEKEIDSHVEKILNLKKNIFSSMQNSVIESYL